MSTTDEAEVKRLGAKVIETGASPVDRPVSGGCHRAATGNIAIFAGCDRDVFERMLPVLTTSAAGCPHRRSAGIGAQGLTNYLPPPPSRAEALVTAKAAGMDLNTTYEAIAISSGNCSSTTESGDLNGSPDDQLHHDPSWDISLFQAIASSRCCSR